VSRYQKGKTRKVKTNLDLLEQEIVSGSGICWALCKSALHPRQPRQHPTTQFFYRPDALPATQSTPSKHWRQKKNQIQLIHNITNTFVPLLLLRVLFLLSVAGSVYKTARISPQFTSKHPYLTFCYNWHPEHSLWYHIWFIIRLSEKNFTNTKWKCMMFKKQITNSYSQKTCLDDNFPF